MKGSKYGYIFGLIIGISLFAFAINYMFFKGNRASEVEVNLYLDNSKVETFTVNSWLGEGMNNISLHCKEVQTLPFLNGLHFMM